MYSPGGLPVERQLLTVVTAPAGPLRPGSRERLSIEPPPPWFGQLEVADHEGPEPMSIVTSSR
jgi:hypothetical protein